jgi:hypothetical protein
MPHYLPQYYLRGFSTDKRTVYQVEKSTSKHYVRQITDLALIRELHEIGDDFEAGPLALEKRLAQTDAVHSAHLAEVLNGGIRDAAVRANLIQILAALRMRVPSVKSHIDRSFESTVRATLKAIDLSGELPSPTEHIDMASSPDDLTFSGTNWKYLDIMSRMAANEKLLTTLADMRATLYRAPAGMSFLTCDQPVSLYHADLTGEPSGASPATPGVEISLPLSSRMLLLLDHQVGEDSECEATPQQVPEFNRRTVVMAKSCIFTESVAGEVASLVRNHSQKSAGFMRDQLHSDGERVQILWFQPVGPA